MRRITSVRINNLKAAWLFGGLALLLLTSLTVPENLSEAAQCDQQTFGGSGHSDGQNKHGITCARDLLVIESNGQPSIPFEQTTPNRVRSRVLRFEIPRAPKETFAPVRMPLLGPVAVAIDGLPFFGPNEAPPTFGDPILDDLLDSCNGHPNEIGLYHYHARPTCLTADREGQPGVVVGYAFDGYPILAPFECANADCSSVYEVKSSYVYTGGTANAWQAHRFSPGAGHLDECNGMTRPDGSYAYYATRSFPYVIACYHGQPRRQPNAMGRASERPQAAHLSR